MSKRRAALFAASLFAFGSTVVVVGAPSTASGGGATAGPAAAAVTSTPSGPPVERSSEEAVAYDVELAAEVMGWTLEQAWANHRSAEAVAAVAAHVADTNPGAFVGSALSDDPEGAPTLYVKGPATADVKGLIAKAGVPVVVADNQPFSFDELEVKKMAVHNALLAQGFRSVASGFDFRQPGRVNASVVRRDGLPTDPDTIVGWLPKELRAGVRLTVRDRSAGQWKSAYGGNWVSWSSGTENDNCSSGFSVYVVATPPANEPVGTTGITTAGHCPDTLNSIEDFFTPQPRVEHPYAVQADHVGSLGDIEWGTTGTSTTPAVDVPQFIDVSGGLRRVTGVAELPSLTVGLFVCAYGAHTRGALLDQSPTCSNILVPSLSCTSAEDGITRSGMIRVDDAIQIGGDSGGSLYRTTLAYGSTIGICQEINEGDLFSAARLYDEALGVRIRLSQTQGSGVRLYTNDKLVSTDGTHGYGRFTAVMQSDGNFVLYQNGVGALWSTGTNGNPGAQLVMQLDGNLVVRRTNGTAAWASNTSGSGHYVTMQTDGNLVMYGPGGAKWSSGTCCH